MQVHLYLKTSKKSDRVRLFTIVDGNGMNGTDIIDLKLIWNHQYYKDILFITNQYTSKDEFHAKLKLKCQIAVGFMLF